MSERVAAWLRQSEHDLNHARAALDGGSHDWACVAAAHGAEGAVKAALVAADAGALGGQNLLLLLDHVRGHCGDDHVPEAVADDARALMEVLGLTAGQSCYSGIAPYELLSRRQADNALAAATRLCRHFLALSATLDR
jgi:HEPN domain-containing protein